MCFSCMSEKHESSQEYKNMGPIESSQLVRVAALLFPILELEKKAIENVTQGLEKVPHCPLCQPHVDTM